MKDDDEYTADELADLKIVIELLSGVTEKDKGGLPKKRYFKGSEETKPRSAIARLLRNHKPLDAALRNQLAALFDPNEEPPPYSTFDNTPIERKLGFVKRGRGRGREETRSLAIAFEVLERSAFHEREGTRMPITTAIDEIAEKYKMDTRTISDAWQQACKRYPLK